MAKIYNEIIIDMNPESSTFEETLFEDSYDYNGNLMLMQDRPGEEEGGDLDVGTSGDPNLQYSEGSRTYGLQSLSAEDFFSEDGTPIPLPQAVALLLKHKPMPEDYEGGITQYKTDMEAKVKDMMPKLQKVSKEELGFLKEEKGLAMGKAKDAYGLTTRAAERGLGTSLGESQKQASSLGGAMRGAYGGSSMGMRGAIGGQQTLAKGVESTYGAFQDKMTGAEQTLGYAETQADLTQRKGEYGLKEDVRTDFEADMGTFLENFKQGGRVPNKKETFLEVLSKLPDAGGI